MKDEKYFSVLHKELSQVDRDARQICVFLDFEEERVGAEVED